jgi:hypothetical protein
MGLLTEIMLEATSAQKIEEGVLFFVKVRPTFNICKLYQYSFVF